MFGALYCIAKKPGLLRKLKIFGEFQNVVWRRMKKIKSFRESN